MCGVCGCGDPDRRDARALARAAAARLVRVERDIL